MAMWWHGYYGSAFGAVVEEIESGGFTANRDDVGTWLRTARGLLDALEALADGQKPSAHFRHQSPKRGPSGQSQRSEPGITILPGEDLPKRMRLAQTLKAFHSQTSSDTPVTRQSVERWIDIKHVNAYCDFDLEVRDRIRGVAQTLERSLRSDAFKKKLDGFTPAEFMSCVIDVLPVLAQTGQLENAFRFGSPLLVDPRLFGVFDLFELSVPQDGAKATKILDITLAIEESVQWGTTKDGAARKFAGPKGAEALKAGFASPIKTVEIYQLYREVLIPAIITNHISKATPLTHFSEEVGDLVKRSILPFYPTDTFKSDRSLTELKADVEAYDAAHPARWRAWDSKFATPLDLVAVGTSAFTSGIDLCIALEKIKAEGELTERNLAELMGAGFRFIDGGIAVSAALNPSLAEEIGQGIKSRKTILAKKLLGKALFVLEIYDAILLSKTLVSSTSKAEALGRSLMLTGAMIGVGLAGINLLATAGMISVAASPVLVATLIGIALGLLGGGAIALFHQDYPEQILRGCFFRKDPKDRQVALNKKWRASDPRAEFVTQVNNEVHENLYLQIAYVVGLTRGFSPSAENISGIIGRRVRYKLNRTPHSNNAPTSAADMKADRVFLSNLDFHSYKSSDIEREIEKKLFEEVINPYTATNRGITKPPLVFEIMYVLKDVPLAFEPLQRGVVRWVADNIAAANPGGKKPDWAPKEKIQPLLIYERAKAT